jgi:hypothetical protein
VLDLAVQVLPALLRHREEALAVRPGVPALPPLHRHRPPPARAGRWIYNRLSGIRRDAR